jgi:hypothetical protein
VGFLVPRVIYLSYIGTIFSQRRLLRTPDNTGNAHVRIRTDFGNFLKTVAYKSGQNGVKSVWWSNILSGQKWKIYFSIDTISGQKCRGRPRHHLFIGIYSKFDCSNALGSKHLFRRVWATNLASKSSRSVSSSAISSALQTSQ